MILNGLTLIIVLSWDYPTSYHMLAHFILLFQDDSQLIRQESRDMLSSSFLTSLFPLFQDGWLSHWKYSNYLSTMLRKMTFVRYTIEECFDESWWLILYVVECFSIFFLVFEHVYLKLFQFYSLMLLFFSRLVWICLKSFIRHRLNIRWFPILHYQNFILLVHLDWYLIFFLF